MIFFAQCSVGQSAIVGAEYTRGALPGEARHSSSPSRCQRGTECPISPEPADRMRDLAWSARIKKESRISDQFRQTCHVRTPRGRTGKKRFHNGHSKSLKYCRKYHTSAQLVETL